MRKRSNIKGILLQVLLLIPIMSYATEDVEIMVSGSGVTKEAAVNNALRSALEQSYGTFVSTSTNVLNDKLVSDEIISLSRGNIKSYNILSEKQLTNGHWYVLVKATVNVNKLIKYVQGEGSSVEVDMRAFGAKVQMEELNRNAERRIIEDLIAEIEAIDLWDYSLELDEPSLSGDQYMISGIVNVRYNDNTIAVVNMIIDVFRTLDLNNQQSNIIKGGDYYKYYMDGSRGGVVFPYDNGIPYENGNIILRNKYNNGLLVYQQGRWKRGLIEPIIDDDRFFSNSLFMSKIRFSISPIGITVAGNNCAVSQSRSDCKSEIDNDNGRLYLCPSETKKTYVSMPKTNWNDIILHEIGETVFRIHFEKAISREEAIKIKRVTIQPL